MKGDQPESPLLAAADEWAGLLEAEDYEGAFCFTLHDASMGWTADFIRAVVKSYGDALSTQRVTVTGLPTDITQRKEVDWSADANGDARGEVWYDLNLDGFVTDLTATFDIVHTDEGYMLRLRDIHVM